MHKQELSPEESARVKSLILEHSTISPDVLTCQFLENPVSDVVNCRIEATSLRLRQALVDRYNGIAMGTSVYFSIPMEAKKKTAAGRMPVARPTSAS
jgi:hypothetical protein